MKHFKPFSFKAKFPGGSGLRRQDISWSLDCHTISQSTGNSSTALPVNHEFELTNVYLPKDTDALDIF